MSTDGNGDSSQAEQPQPDQRNVASSTFHKLPVFWSNMPDVWFIQVEQIFSINRITSDVSKYRHVVAVLPQEAMGNVVDLLRNPPNENKYEMLKEALISRHSMSENKKLEELLSSSEMGDRSPSSFYREMENLTGNSNFVNQSLLKKLWLRKLPENIKLAVTCYNVEEVTELLAMADRLWETTQSSRISEIKSNNSSTKEDKLIEAIKSLSLEVSSLKERVSRNSYKGNDYKRGRSRSSSRSRNRDKYKYCWYHWKFADKASKCIPPCQFTTDRKERNDLKE